MKFRKTSKIQLAAPSPTRIQDGITHSSLLRLLSSDPKPRLKGDRQKWELIEKSPAYSYFPEASPDGKAVRALGRIKLETADS